LGEILRFAYLIKKRQLGENMKNIEYTKMAYLYDEFYANKKYEKEVDFIKSFIKDKNCKILDAGSGTGNHAKILSDLGYTVKGFDQSEEMVEIANSKVKNAFEVGELLTFKSDEKYDLIISFFAVFNHLKNYKEFELALKNLKACLNEEGTIIIDLHNPLKSGKKIEELKNAKRIMKWRKLSLLKKEFSKITYIVGNKKYKTSHTFKIFQIAKLQKIAESLDFGSINFYENYGNLAATKNSKNIQMVLTL